MGVKMHKDVEDPFAVGWESPNLEDHWAWTIFVCMSTALAQIYTDAQCATSILALDQSARITWLWRALLAISPYRRVPSGDGNGFHIWRESDCLCIGTDCKGVVSLGSPPIGWYSRGPERHSPWRAALMRHSWGHSSPVSGTKAGLPLLSGVLGLGLYIAECKNSLLFSRLGSVDSVWEEKIYAWGAKCDQVLLWAQHQPHFSV